MVKRKQTEQYKGPIVYIVHSPMDENYARTIGGKEIAKEEIHFQKIAKLLGFAKKYGLPIFWEKYRTDENKIDELLKKVKIDKKEIYFTDASFSGLELFLKSRITPTKIIIGGHFTELCSIGSAEILHRLLPKAEIVILRGDYNLSATHYPDALTKKSAQVAEYIAVVAKPKYKFTREILGIKRSPLRRKLLR